MLHGQDACRRDSQDGCAPTERRAEFILFFFGLGGQIASYAGFRAGED